MTLGKSAGRNSENVFISIFEIFQNDTKQFLYPARIPCYLTDEMLYKNLRTNGPAKVNDRNTKKRCEISSKLTTKTPERSQ